MKCAANFFGWLAHLVGKDTATLIDGKSLMSENELSGLGVLKLIECKVLKDSYIRLRYEVIG